MPRRIAICALLLITGATALASSALAAPVAETFASSTPLAVTTNGRDQLGGVTSVSSGYSHSCAQLGRGELRCWGSNFAGQLGDGSDRDSSSPVAVRGLKAGAVSSGRLFSCALLATAQARCWGSNSQGQLGSGQDLLSSPWPLDVKGLATAAEVKAGGEHACALLANGQVRCWGDNHYGQLGRATERGGPVSGLGPVTQLSTGLAHSCARLSGGQVACWGSNASGQLGPPTERRCRALGRPSRTVACSRRPLTVAGLSSATQVAAGDAFSCALLLDRTVSCWGSNASGQLGDGINGGKRRSSQTPVKVKGLESVTEISAGAHHVCALLANGQARCWGSNSHGELGDGTTENHAQPVAVTQEGGLTQVGVDAISAGGHHSCALLEDGTLACWGDNRFGQLAAPIPADTESVTGDNSSLDIIAALLMVYLVVCAAAGLLIGLCYGRD